MRGLLRGGRRGGVRSGPGAARTILLFHTISDRPSKQPRMVESRERDLYWINLGESPLASVKYKDYPNWWTHSLLREGYGKDKHWVLLGLPSRDSA